MYSASETAQDELKSGQVLIPASDHRLRGKNCGGDGGFLISGRIAGAYIRLLFGST